MTEALTIGEMAKRGGVGVETVRYYERRGLIPEPPRNDSGYRQYDDKDVERVRFIKRVQQLGFTLNEIEALLKLRGDDLAECNGIHEMLQTKHEELTDELHRLERVRETISTLLTKCTMRGSIRDCMVLQQLEPNGADFTLLGDE